jgi:hypothetical protein
MSMWQVSVLLALAGAATVCLFGIFKALNNLAKGFSSIAAELAKLNGKLERVEAVNGDDSSLEALESAFSTFEKLKRV